MARPTRALIVVTGMVALVLAMLAQTATAAGTFTDDDGSVHEPAIEALVEADVIEGCADGLFCPDLPITRAQIALLLDRAFGLDATSIDFFDDDDDTFAEPSINRLAAADITDGCAAGLRSFCPSLFLTRAQLASLLARAFELDSATRDFFFDDNGTVHEDAINRAADADITRGCDANQIRRFCPNDLVTRAQFASLLARALGLLENAVPVADDQSVTTPWGDPIEIQLTATDADGDPLTFAIATTPTNGALTGPDADGIVTYTADANFVGLDEFTFTANDRLATSVPATVTIDVTFYVPPPSTPPNDPPTFDTRAAQTAPENQTAVHTVAATDPDGDPVTFSLDGGGADAAQFSILPTGELSFLAAPDFEVPTDTGADGVYEVDVTARDDRGGAATQTVLVTVTDVNDAPVAVNDDADITEEAPNDATGDNNTVAGDVLANDDDQDPADTLSVDQVQGAADGSALGVTAPTVATGDFGTLSIDTDGGFTYTLDDANPTVNALTTGTLTDDFTYRATDGTATDTAVLTVTITGADDPPVVVDETFTVACNVEHVVADADADPADAASATGTVVRTIDDNLLAGETDPEEQGELTITGASGATSDATGPTFDITTDEGGTATVWPDGSFTYTPEGGDRDLDDSFDYTVTDATGATSTATVTLEIADLCIWFVDNSVNTADGTGDGTSSNPFSSLVDETSPDTLADDAEDAAQAGDVIYVLAGNSTTSDPYVGGITLTDGQRLLGEDVDLVVDLGEGDETVRAATGTRPVVALTADGRNVYIPAATDVEVAGLELRGTSDTPGPTIQGVVISDGDQVDVHHNTISATGGSAVFASIRGLDSELRIADNDLVSVGGQGINAAVGTVGSIELVADRNTLVGLNGIRIDGAGNGVVVTSMCDNTVEAAIEFGIRVSGDVTFDADPSDADFTGDTVACTGTTTIGTPALPLTGNGLALEGPTGDLSFADLDIHTTGTDTTAIEVTAAGALNAAAGTGFRLATSGGTITSGDGPALSIDPATIAMDLDSVSSTGSGSHAILLEDATGTLNVTAGTITGAATNAFAIDNAGGGALNTTFGGTITHASSGAAVDVLDHSSGTVTFTNTISATAGTGLQFTDADGSYQFPQQVTLNGGDAGVDIDGGSDGSFSFTNTDITSPSGTALDIDASGPSQVTFGVASSITQASNAATIAITNRTAGIFTHSGTISATNGSGLQFVADDGTQTNFNGTITLNGGDAGVDITNGTSSSHTYANMTITNPSGTAFNREASDNAVTWTAGGITKNTAGYLFDFDRNTGGVVNLNAGPFVQDVGTGFGIRADRNETSTINVNGAVDLGANNRLLSDAVVMTGESTGFSLTFADLDVRTRNARGLVKTGDSTLSVTTGTIDATGDFCCAGIDLDGGTANVTLTDVNVTNDGVGGGVELTNVAGTKNFASVQVTTTNGGTGFSASSAGTINVTGTDNTISATGLKALDITNTIIGGSNATFQSISSSGATNGIVLDTTGAFGGLTVTGTGTTAGSGGTIQNSTGDGVLLNDTFDVSLSNITIQNSTGSNVDATGVAGLDLIDSTLDGSSTHSFLGSTVRDLRLIRTVVDGGSGTAANVDGVRITNLLGTNLFDGATFRDGKDIGVLIENTLATSASTSAPDTLTIRNGTSFSNTGGGDHLQVEADGTANLSLTIEAGTANNTFAGTGQDGMQLEAEGAGRLVADITGATFTGTVGSVANLATAGSGTMIADVHDLTGLTSSGTNVLNAISFDTSSLTATFENNTITSATAGNGIRVIQEGNGTVVVGIEGNNIQGVTQGSGILVQGRAGTGGQGRIDATIDNNFVRTTTALALDGIEVTSGSSAGGDTNTICLNMLDNNSASEAFDGYFLRHRAGSTFQLQEFTGPSSSATITAWVNVTKSNTGSVFVSGASSFVTAPTNCATPA